MQPLHSGCHASCTAGDNWQNTGAKPEARGVEQWKLKQQRRAAGQQALEGDVSEVSCVRCSVLCVVCDLLRVRLCVVCEVRSVVCEVL